MKTPFPALEPPSHRQAAPRFRRVVWMIVGGIFTVGANGCMSVPDARYIYQDGEFGVIGIPHNSPYGSKNYLKQANELMAQHFPDGYEIVRSEEVMEGQRVLDRGKKTEFETDPSINALNQKIQVGKIAESITSQQKDSIPILESRIIYKRHVRGTPRGPSGFAASSTLVPENYIDPNAVARCRAQFEIAEARKGKSASMASITHKVEDSTKKVDTELKTTSTEVKKPDPPK